MQRIYGIVLKTEHYAAFVGMLLAIIADIILSFGKWYFFPILVVVVLLGILPFILDFFNEIKRQKEIETKFLEFVRNLVETVRSGVNIPQAIAQVKNSGANFGALSPYVNKLANQLEWGYPLHNAFTVFAKDTRNPVIERSVSIVIQAEKSGGDMASVLEAVTQSVLEVKQIKDEMKSSAYNQIIQGYVIFFVFVGIMIVMQIFLLPKLGDIGSEIGGSIGGMMGGGGTSPVEKADLSPIFILTVIVQGLFAGIMLGLFSEGKISPGIKHSIILMTVGYLIITVMTGIAGTPEPAATVAKTSIFLLIPASRLFKK